MSGLGNCCKILREDQPKGSFTVTCRGNRGRISREVPQEFVDSSLPPPGNNCLVDKINCVKLNFST